MLHSQPDLKEKKLLALYGSFEDCKRCRLHETRRSLVFGSGPSETKLVFIGEAPGEAEDATGNPFVGRAGQLLRRSMDEVGIDAAACFLTNLLGCRPPENRVPMPDEVTACRPRIYALLSVLNPEVVVVVGGTAMIGLIAGVRGGITKNRGRTLTLDFDWKAKAYSFKAIPILHPAGLLRPHTDKDKERFVLDLAYAAELAGLVKPSKRSAAPEPDIEDTEEVEDSDGGEG